MIKTTKKIIQENIDAYNIGESLNDKWFKINDNLDIYNELCKVFGKVRIWDCNSDELCDLFEEYLKSGGK